MLGGNLGSLLYGDVSVMKQKVTLFFFSYSVSDIIQSYYYKIQETLFRVDFQIYNRITLAISYFVDKHDLKILYKYT